MKRLGAILAGGQARRFGSDKAAAMLWGKPLIEHVAAALAAQVDAIVLVGRAWQGLESLADRPPGKLGPLAGLNAALHHAAARGQDGVLSAGCDTLPVPPDLADRLGEAGPAYIEGHYLLGWWPVALAEMLDRHMATSDDRSLRGWIAHCGAISVATPEPLHNLNTPVELAAYQRLTAS